MKTIKDPDTPWGQKAWQALGGFFRQYNEENRKLAEAEKRERAQPFGQADRLNVVETATQQSTNSGSSLRTFDWRNYTNSSVADSSNIINLPENKEIGNLQKLDKTLQKVFNFIGEPSPINSAFRNTELNRIVGGVKNSEHRKGYAVDFNLPNNRHKALMIWIRDNVPEITQVISYPASENGGFVHISVDPKSKGERRFLEEIQMNGQKIKRSYSFR